MAEETTEKPNEIVTTVQEMLKEETWTRASISGFTKNNLTELSKIVDKARAEKCSMAVQEICDEHLMHTKDSITALYISGMISLYDGTLDNSALENLADIFQKNHKDALVVSLCETILEDDSNNKFALHSLANCYKNNNDEKMWDLYEQIVKIDFEEAYMAKALAERAENAAKTESDKDKVAKLMKEAISYYKKALLRYITTKNTNELKDVWEKLVELIPEEIDFFTLAKRKIAKTISEDRSIDLMKDLYVWYKENKLWDTSIDILKQNLEIDPHDTWARREIVECYREKFSDRANVEDFIRQSNLAQSFRNVFEAINDFEKHIAFDAGSYVFHRQWRVGIIKKVENDTLTINFSKKFGVKTMSLKMAVQALTPLAKDHIWVLKATTPRAELTKKIKDDKTWALKTIIKSFDNNCDMKRIKAELVAPVEKTQDKTDTAKKQPASILTAGEWTSWNNAAKKILESDPMFSVSPDNASFYTVREREMNIEEKLSNEFKAQKLFYPRIDILMKYAENEECDNTSESFNEMVSYFAAFLKSPTKISDQEIAAFLTQEYVSKIDETIPLQSKYSFQELYKKTEDPRIIYRKLKDSKNTILLKNFLAKVKQMPTWIDEYIKLFPVLPEKNMLETLVASGGTEKVKKLVQDSFENYKANRSTVIFLFKECRDEDWYKDANVPYEKQLISLVSIIEQDFREINSHVNTTENKKFNKNAIEILFGSEKNSNKNPPVLIDYIMEKDEDTIKRFYTLVNDIEDLDGIYKQRVRNKILEKYPEFKFQTEVAAQVQSHDMIVTAQKLAEKREELDHLQNVEIPANNKEISEARAQGDLKENAEYEEARNEQKRLNSRLAKLQEELELATVFDPATVNTSVVSFGTKVTLQSNITNEEVVYVILGEWESEPEKGIISYMSPLGKELLNLEVGENATFTINETDYDYTVKSIEAAN